MKIKKTKREIEQRIATMQLGDWFMVGSEKERQRASKAAATLKRAGIISFEVKTWSEGSQFKIAAI